MYDWRNLSEVDKDRTLEWRKFRAYPKHNTPHLEGVSKLYHISAACFEHKNIIGLNPVRMNEFCKKLVAFCEAHDLGLHAWCVLPNHYHLLLRIEDLKEFSILHGRFHGSLSHQWNSEDGTRGRKCFFNHSDRAIRSERHFWVTMNYVHNNPVHHTYVKKWQEWPYSSAIDFIASVGIEQARTIWREFPVRDYGKKWDV
ncbi:hypothetical protein PQO03_14935 [Lentisphaera profundi]|uniref:Transposase IS200-like domain-containing protein n=1 Tax=Lentisphaera profundi TaxID=1658616 RepID=A0ABY7W2E2_9BACT|nr:hypothetical protein [Lentisphaera profundi]WDE99129.1 hypothetical protein PQO03_14935 [Lentisphaera profundi]